MVRPFIGRRFLTPLFDPNPPTNLLHPIGRIDPKRARPDPTRPDLDPDPDPTPTRPDPDRLRFELGGGLDRASGRCRVGREGEGWGGMEAGMEEGGWVVGGVGWGWGWGGRCGDGDGVGGWETRTFFGYRASKTFARDYFVVKVHQIFSHNDLLDPKPWIFTHLQWIFNGFSQGNFGRCGRA